MSALPRRMWSAVGPPRRSVTVAGGEEARMVRVLIGRALLCVAVAAAGIPLRRVRHD